MRSERGDVLLRSARLVGTAGDPLDLLIEDGVITAIGETIDSNAAQVVEVGGRWVSPGLWDSHVHMGQWALLRQRLDLSSATSAAGAALLVGERLREMPPPAGQPLIGYGFQDGLWPDAPSAELLDAVSADVPVVLVSKDLHTAWLNSPALANHGHAGHPTGLLREQAAFDVNARISALPDEHLDAWVADAVQAAAARGVVGIVDLEMTLSIDRWAHRVATGTRGLRVRTGVYAQDLDAVIARGLRTGDVIDGTDGLVTMGPFKIITDGSLNTRTAFCHDPYPGLEGKDGGHGISTVNGNDLVDHLRRASSAGLVPAVHAIGDAANSLVLDAFEEIGCGGSIEHAQLVREEDFGRFAQLGITASVQPEHAMDDRDVADRYWPGRTHRAFAFASLVAAGVRITLGSDAPVAQLDPWVSMAAAVSRARDGREAWHPEQRVLSSVALAASTDGRATLRAGSVADLVISELDPLVAGDQQLRNFQVSATMLDGRWTHFTLD
ncbi:amidohydrolase [Arthrobacter burdickii]|uniref:Amidohydrolase family protein n=1 Tax=Arthrobacter burdickii TaxID=3035920 RepID=A0ABT8K4I2_9MICC|nr:amidohydrolase family protein [Arthrobacter burdickii]MDN4612345.1 amidohydrolase family protein [Arthrobacter burdickii]